MAQSTLPNWISEHIALYKKDPETAHMWDSGPLGGPGLLPTLLLTTTGRKSGDAKSLPLIYKEVDGYFVIIASKGGSPTHPVWFLNLQANPECEIQVANRHFRTTMRVATGADRDQLWSQMAQIYPPYNDYQESAGEREIPVVILEPKT